MTFKEQLLQTIKERTARVAVIGLGYVGLPLAVEKAKAGFTVIGIDRKQDRVKRVNRGESYIPDVSSGELSKVVRDEKLRATQDFSVVADVDVVTICVPTPLDKNKQPDTSYIEEVVEQLLPYLHAGQLIILESTTYPGTTEEVILPRIESRGLKVGTGIFLAFSPERVDPGNKRYKLKDTPKVVGGVTPHCTEAAKMLYETVLEKEVFTVSSPRAAEMTKLLENIFRVVNVSLVNELAILCDRMSIDIWEVIEAAKTKPFGFMPFYPGPGMGGHCIPVDAFYLSWKAKEYDFPMRFIELAGEINDAMPEYVVNRVTELLNERKKPLNGAKILLIGMAYKRDVDDIRESPALKVAQLLLQRKSRLSYHDPYVSQVELEGQMYSSKALTSKLLQESDLVLITTDHSKINYRMIVKYAPLIYDTRNALKRFNNRKIHRLG